MPKQPAVEIEGIEALNARLRDPELVRGALRILGSRASRTGGRTAKKALDGGGGGATQSIVAKFVPMEGMVFVKSMMSRERGMSIEEGRLPGNPPSLGPVISWKELVGHPESGREIRAELSAKGVRGKRFLEQAMEQWQLSLPRWLGEAARRIEKRFKTGQ